ncbi:MAG: hypothetical protein KDD66_10535 [Bdellovibrionales bacterium]|nr:hypothetical protein [Bdellovibrionales bacterium]
MSRKKENASDTSALVRCGCGAIYNLLDSSVCPVCKKEQTNLSSSAAQAVPTESEQNSASSQNRLLLISAGILLFVWLVRGPDQSTNTVPPKSNSPDKIVNSSSSDAIEALAVVPQFAPVVHISGVDDMRLVGAWDRPQGRELFTLFLGRNGTFALILQGQKGKSKSVGSFGASSSRWTMKSRDGWENEGKYWFTDANTLVINGRDGQHQWARAPAERVAELTNDADPDILVVNQDSYVKQLRSNRSSNSFMERNGILPP